MRCFRSRRLPAGSRVSASQQWQPHATTCDGQGHLRSIALQLHALLQAVGKYHLLRWRVLVLAGVRLRGSSADPHVMQAGRQVHVKGRHVFPRQAGRQAGARHRQWSQASKTHVHTCVRCPPPSPLFVCLLVCLFACLFVFHACSRALRLTSVPLPSSCQPTGRAAGRGRLPARLPARPPASLPAGERALCGLQAQGRADVRSQPRRAGLRGHHLQVSQLYCTVLHCDHHLHHLHHEVSQLQPLLLGPPPGQPAVLLLLCHCSHLHNRPAPCPHGHAWLPGWALVALGRVGTQAIRQAVQDSNALLLMSRP